MRESVRFLLIWEMISGVVGGRVTGRFRRSGGVVEGKGGGIVGMIGGSRARVWVLQVRFVIGRANVAVMHVWRMYGSEKKRI